MHSDLVYWSDHGYGQVRMWKSGWADDRFEIMERQDFDVFRAICYRLDITVVEG